MIRVILTGRSPASDGFPLNHDAGLYVRLAFKRGLIDGVDADGHECSTGVYNEGHRFCVYVVHYGKNVPVYYHELRLIPVATNEG